MPENLGVGKLFVTGAGGFVGSALCEQLSALGIHFVKGRRSASLSPEMGVNVVVHLASRVHVMQEDLRNSLSAYREANTELTLDLARQAVAVGVRRFVFISTAKVNGEGAAVAYSESDIPRPEDPYAISKWEAEQGLWEIAAGSGMEVVIVRPPLVYGPGVKANFLYMMRWLGRGVPLPFGAIHNKRSLVALGNLVDFLITCIAHPAAANQTFFVSDDDDLSTTDLLVRVAALLGKPARLMDIPIWMLKVGATVLGKGDFYLRLCGNFQVNIFKAKNILGWSPPLTVGEGLRVAVEHYLAGCRAKA